METIRDTLIIRIAKAQGRLGMSAFYNNKNAEIVPYSEIAAPEKDIAVSCEQVADILSTADREAEGRDAGLAALTEAGRKLFETIFTDGIKRCIRKAQVNYLIFSVDEDLLSIPWELLHDGRDFLCLGFALSRSAGRQEFTGVQYREMKGALKALVLAPSSAYLGMTYNEGIAVINAMYARRARIKTSLKIMEVESAFVNANIKDCAIVHFAGHVEYNPYDSSRSGWVFSGGIFSSDRMRAMAKTPPFPSFIYSDAYQYDRPEKWQVKRSCQKEAHSLAQALFLSGVKHYIETFYKIPDKARLLFVTQFYNLVMADETVGDALRLSRSKLIEVYGASSLCWATYMLYGDPAMTIFEERIEPSSAVAEASKKPASFNILAANKIKMLLIIIAVCAATFFTDRLFNRVYNADKSTQMGEEIGSGLKYLSHLKETGTTFPKSAVGLESLKGTVTFNIIDWFKSAINERKRMAATRPVRKTGAPQEAQRSFIGENESTALLDELFSLDQAVYHNMLARVKVKDVVTFGAIPAKVRPIKDWRVRKFFTEAKIFYSRGDYQAALNFAQRALNVAWIADDRRDESMVLGLLGAVCLELSQEKEAIAYMEQNKILLDDLGVPLGLADTCFNLGLAWSLPATIGIAGENDIGNFKAALEIYRSIDDENDIMWVYIMMGYSYAKREKYDKALGCLDEALKITMKTDDKMAQGMLYKAYGDMCITKRDYISAQGFYNQALTINRFLEPEANSLAYLDTLYRLAFLNLASYDYEKASDFFWQVVKFMEGAKETRYTKAYSYIFKSLKTLLVKKDDIAKDVMKQLYAHMAACYFDLNDYKSADRCVDLALRYQ